MVTQDEAVKTVNLMIDSLSQQSEKFQQDYYLLVSIEIANHLADYAMMFKDQKKIQMMSGDEFLWRGFRCKVA